MNGHFNKNKNVQEPKSIFSKNKNKNKSKKACHNK